MKMRKDYVKSDVMKRVDKYKKKVLYEELKLREKQRSEVVDSPQT